YYHLFVCSSHGPSYHSLSPLLSFLFPPFYHHWDLHSFPTRRSSDLGRICWEGGCSCRWKDCGVFRYGVPRSFHTRTNSPHAQPRSEEHTSELQSRFDLVCRLLLEKKKQIDVLTNRLLLPFYLNHSLF